MRLAPSSTKLRNFGYLNLGTNVVLSLASFVLGVVVSRTPLPSANGAERELVSGAALSTSSSGASSGVAPAAVLSPAITPPQLGQPVANAVAETPRGTKGKTPEPEPSWSRLAGRAQSWTAAVRADLNYGAGVVVDPTGLVLTNLHVIANARAITVTPFGSGPSPAKLLDSDPELDLALLRASLPSPLPQAAALFGSTTGLAVGDEVLAVGSPRKMYFSVSRGMVSFPNRLLEGVEYIQTDLPINEGNSGGPLVNREGRVVGIVSFILKESQGLSFALPIERAIERFAPYLEPSKAAPSVSRELPTREPPARRAH